MSYSKRYEQSQELKMHGGTNHSVDVDEPIDIEKIKRQFMETPRSTSSSKRKTTSSRPAAATSKNSTIQQGNSPVPQPPATYNSHGASASRDPLAEATEQLKSAPITFLEPLSTEDFAGKLQHIIANREAMEKLMVDQRKEEGALHAVLDRIQSASRSATPRANGDDVNPGEVKMMLVPETQLLQLVQERERALSLLKSFRDEGNAVIYRMYNVIKQKEKKNVELLATLETLQKSNERLRQIQRQVTNMTGSTSPYHQLNHNEISEHCKRCVEKEKIIEGQRKLVSELDELLRNADTTLLAMKGRAEAAEQQLREVLQERKAASPQSIVYVKEGEVPESAVGTDGEDSTLLARYPKDEEVRTLLQRLHEQDSTVNDLRLKLLDEQQNRLVSEEKSQELHLANERQVVRLEEQLKELHALHTASTHRKEEATPTRPLFDQGNPNGGSKSPVSHTSSSSLNNETNNNETTTTNNNGNDSAAMEETPLPQQPLVEASPEKKTAATSVSPSQPATLAAGGPTPLATPVSKPPLAAGGKTPAAAAPTTAGKAPAKAPAAGKAPPAKGPAKAVAKAPPKLTKEQKKEQKRLEKLKKKEEKEKEKKLKKQREEQARKSKENSAQKKKPQ